MAASTEQPVFGEDVGVEDEAAQTERGAERRVTGVGAADVLATLDEPVSTTIMRDLRRVWVRLSHVMLPVGGATDDTLKHLKEWDLWGPLLLCLILSLALSLTAPVGQASLVFASVFVLVWAGAAVVTLNAQLLGAKLSFFQSVCVLGYCVAPLSVAALLALLWRNTIFRAVLTVVGYLWSTRASLVFISSIVPEARRGLALYPVLLFYVVIAWMVYVE